MAKQYPPEEYSAAKDQREENQSYAEFWAERKRAEAAEDEAARDKKRRAREAAETVRAASDISEEDWRFVRRRCPTGKSSRVLGTVLVLLGVLPAILQDRVGVGMLLIGTFVWGVGAIHDHRLVNTRGEAS